MNSIFCDGNKGDQEESLCGRLIAWKCRAISVEWSAQELLDISCAIVPHRHNATALASASLPPTFGRMDHFHGLLFCSLDVIVQDMIPLFSWWAASSKRQSQNSIWPEYRGSPDFAQGKLLLFLAVGRNFLDTDQESNEAAAPSSCGTIFQLRVEPNANLENR